MPSQGGSEIGSATFSRVLGVVLGRLVGVVTLPISQIRVHGRRDGCKTKGNPGNEVGQGLAISAGSRNVHSRQPRPARSVATHGRAKTTQYTSVQEFTSASFSRSCKTRRRRHANPLTMRACEGADLYKEAWSRPRERS